MRACVWFKYSVVSDRRFKKKGRAERVGVGDGFQNSIF